MMGWLFHFFWFIWHRMTL